MKQKKKKRKNVVLNMSERDYRKLGDYARLCGARRGIVAMRLIREGLKNKAVAAHEARIDNQLEIFDTVQIQLFDNVD